MGIKLKPSDLYYKYGKDVANRDQPKFHGKPDPSPFNRNDIYDVLPMLEAVMDALASTDGRLLNLVEDILNCNMPQFISTREEVFDFLIGSANELIENR